MKPNLYDVKVIRWCMNLIGIGFFIWCFATEFDRETTAVACIAAWLIFVEAITKH